MSGSIRDNPKPRGRPKTTGKGTLLGVRVQPDQLAILDAWIEAQPEPKPSRPEAIRQLFTMSLGAVTMRAMKRRMHS
jgi:hypothetical protein